MGVRPALSPESEMACAMICNGIESFFTGAAAIARVLSRNTTFTSARFFQVDTASITG